MEVVEQRLSLSVDLLNERLVGYTELNVCHKADLYKGEDLKLLQSKGLASRAQDNTKWGKSVFVNCRQCVVKSVTVNGAVATFVERDALKKVVLQSNVRDLATYYANLTGDILCSKDGELEIILPASQVNEKKLLIRIDYELEKPTGGVKFAACGDMIPDKLRCVSEGWSFTRGKNSKRYYPHMFSYTSLCGGDTLGAGTGARCWFPCVDTLQSRCKFVTEVTVPESLTVVCSGIQRDSVNLSGGLKRVIFEHEDPVAPHNVAIAVGPFKKDSSEHMDWVHAYYLPGRCANRVAKASLHLRRAIKELVEYLLVDGFAAGSFQQVFVDQEFCYTEVAPFATVSIVSDAFLGDTRMPTPDTVAGASLLGDKHPLYLQAMGVAYQLFGCLVPAKSESDVWVIAGLCGYLAYRYAFRSWRPVKIKLPGMPDTVVNPMALLASAGMNLASGSSQQPLLLHKTPPPDEAGQDWFLTSCHPEELLISAFDRLQLAKERFEAVKAQHGVAGCVLQRPLHRPVDVTFPVDSCLWAARGFELDCLFTQRASFMLHSLERMVNLGQDEDERDAFTGILAMYVRKGLEEFDFRASLLYEFNDVPKSARRPQRAGRSLVLAASGLDTLAGVSGSHDDDNVHGMDDSENVNLAGNPNDHTHQQPLLQRSSSTISALGDAEDIGDSQQRQVDSDKSIVGIAEYDFVLRLCKVGGLKAGDFSLYKSGNFFDFWLRKCSFLRLRGGVEYRNNTLELILESSRGHGTRGLMMTNLPLRLRVVEEDDTWHHERSLTKQRNEHTIPLHTAKQKQRGGRKSQTTKERIGRWENPTSLKTSDLLTLFSTDEDDRIWHNEFPVKYCILDPEIMWLRDVEWRQTEVMYLEMLIDPSLTNDVLQISAALKQMAVPSSYTDDLVRSGGASSAATEEKDPSSDKPVVRGDRVYDLRMACAIAGCIVDYRRPPRVRAEAVLRLAEWQRHHAPDRARVEGEKKSGTDSRPEDRPGTHPWVGLNLLLCAARATMFDPRTGKLLPNDFGVPGEQAIKRAMCQALRMVRAKSNKPPDDVLAFVLTLLRENDNSVNNWSDALYLKDLCTCAGEVVAFYVIGTEEEEYRAKGKSASEVERIGQGRTVRDVLGPFYEIIDHLRRLLYYDAIAPSPNHLITQGCLAAFAAMEAAGAVPASTPFFAYAIFDSPVPPSQPDAAIAARHDWGSAVREEAFKAVVQVYILNRDEPSIYCDYASSGERNAAWIGIIQWLLEAVAKDPSPMLRWNVVKLLLKQHADTIENRIPELENHTSPSGLFWPLSNALDDIDPVSRVPTAELTATLWSLFNEQNDCDGRMRMAFSQLWRAIWRLDVPPVVAHTMTTREEGPFRGWTESGNVGDEYDDDDHGEAGKSWWLNGRSNKLAGHRQHHFFFQKAAAAAGTSSPSKRSRSLTPPSPGDMTDMVALNPSKRMKVIVKLSTRK